MELKCPQCGNELRMMVDLFIHAPARYYHDIPKRALQKKEVEIWGANWPMVTFLCWHCGNNIDEYGAPSQISWWKEMVRLLDFLREAVPQHRHAIDAVLLKRIEDLTAPPGWFTNSEDKSPISSQDVRCLIAVKEEYNGKSIAEILERFYFWNGSGRWFPCDGEYDDAVVDEQVAYYQPLPFYMDRKED